MPVHPNLNKEGMLYQREQYAKGGVSKSYRDYKTNLIFRNIKENHQNILEVGCGEGLILERLKDRFPERHIAGIDIEPENISICRKHGLEAIQADVYNLPFLNESFDCCLCIDVFEHLSSPLEALNQMKEVLCHNGRLIVVIPNDRNFFLARMAFGKIKEAFYNAGHVKIWSPSKLKSFLKKEGFSVMENKNIPLAFWSISLHHIIVVDKT